MQMVGKLVQKQQYAKGGKVHKIIQKHRIHKIENKQNTRKLT
jgi:hypothetical protein